MNFNGKKTALAVSLATAVVFAASPAKALDTAFNATMNILTALAVTKTADLGFGNYEAGVVTTVVVAPADATAATFDITAGSAAAPVNLSIVETAGINMTTGAGLLPSEQIPVATWVFGGSATDAGGGTGTATLDGLGQLTNIRVGGTATLDGTDIVGAYSGAATFRVVYQ
ncbi:MAG: hypothetical protein OEY97_07240 [Nitrospirota bacterium]|nr:hypothetical protein [Nitrospirota bacterium]